MAIASLPWFRAGWMPDELRLRLISDMRPELRGVVRDAIETLFFAAAERGEKPTSADPPEVVRPPRGWTRHFREWLKAAPADAPTGDRIFVRYMLGGTPRPGDLDLNNRRLARLAGARLAGWLDWRAWAALAAAALGAALIALAGESLISPRFNAISYRTLGAEVVKECRDCPELAVLAGASFLMGSDAWPDTRPVRRITVPRFAIGRYLVTFDEWAACVADGGCNTYKPDDAGWGRGRRPVINVSWEDAQAYVSWLSRKTDRPYRLPREAEWEYAARAGTETVFPWGQTWDPALANNGYLGKTTEVGTYPPNAFGLYDTIGNVWEWAEDCWHDNYDGAPNDSRAWINSKCDRRVVRGGSWYRDPANLGSANRSSNPSNFRRNTLGFRVARNVESDPIAADVAAKPPETRYRICSLPAFGLKGWEREETLQGTSGWRGGGYNQDAYCTEFTNSIIASRGLGNQPYLVDNVKSGEENRRTGPFNSAAQYNYYCSITLHSNPIYNQKADPLCGPE
jgi:formylglycine-generating enzyme required for sulfatase activity